MENIDPYNLNRFLGAQERIFENVLEELKSGQKRTHWMWFIFPQLEGLGQSTTARYYSIKSQQEALEFLNHPVLGARLLKCAETVLAIEGRSVIEIFSYPDNLKFMSSMTLFACLAGSDSVFTRILDKYFKGERDKLTLDILGDFQT